MRPGTSSRRWFKTNLAALSVAAMLLVVAATLSGCGAVIGIGAATGVAAAEERGIEGAAQDLKLEARVVEKWIKFDHTLPINIGIEVYEGRAMLTGVADNAKVRADAVRLAWSVAGIKDVINEIQVTKSGGVMDFARDTWITTQLKSQITLDENIMAINYAIETSNGVVYLIGISQSQEELDRVIAYARNISYVRKIISHVRIKDKP